MLLPRNFLTAAPRANLSKSLQGNIPAPHFNTVLTPEMSVDLCLSSTVVSDDTFHNMFPLVIVFFSAGIGPLARQVTD